MELNQILTMQRELDEANGFPVALPDLDERYDQVTKDLVGLVGEIGEFANMVKKINIKRANLDKYELDVAAAEASLKEELADSFIYILRLSSMLECDLEQSVVDKIRLNAARYAKLRGK